MNTESFPSPIGELHFSIIMSQDAVALELKFPSPIGELHFSILGEEINSLYVEAVSVPYRGATFLNFSIYHDYTSYNPSFRPLSGSYISQYYISI